MFRRKVLTLADVINKLLREEGLETPLKQKRLIDSWEQIMGDMVAKYTTQKFIKNQTLYVKIENPALRQDLSMMRSQLVKKLNDHVGSFVISDVHIY
ncbi:MAG: DUF721 domain-containing protein [Prevotella sp.]|jgi:predicted nucleic acid-binding Zn ribbon protein|nr:DUF721 domain-containing protein [Prevotella sp.]MCI1282518.1 DUF721 domain-containing protein [Prevotella sp.]